MYGPALVVQGKPPVVRRHQGFCWCLAASGLDPFWLRRGPLLPHKKWQASHHLLGARRALQASGGNQKKGSMTRSTRDMERSDPYLSIPFRSWQESWCALSWPEEFYCRPFRCREHGWVGGTLGGSPDSDGFMASHWPWIFTEWRCNWVRFAQMRIRNVCLDAGVSSTKMFVHFSKKDWTLLDSLNISIWNAPDLFIAPAQGSCYSYQAASGSRCGKNAKDGEW